MVYRCSELLAIKEAISTQALLDSLTTKQSLL